MWRQKIVPGRTPNQSWADLFASLGRRITQYREARRWTRRHLARRLGVAVKTVANWEQGRVQVPFLKLVALAEHLGVSMDELAREEPDPRPKELNAPFRGHEGPEARERRLQ